jgi:Icc-related predicted phosphoesterase
MKIVALSDTHRQEWKIQIPECDILIHAGDCDIYNLEHLIKLNIWFNLQPAKHKIFVAGNHDLYLDNCNTEFIQEMLPSCIYLQNNSIEIEGLKIWGSPYSPIFMNWAFMKSDKELKRFYDKIPQDTDIIISHTMPYGILDQVLPRMENVGSVSLRDRVKIIMPKIFIGGHLHAQGGQNYTDFTTDYYNVSVLDDNYQIANPVTIIDI